MGRLDKTLKDNAKKMEQDVASAIRAEIEKAWGPKKSKQNQWKGVKKESVLLDEGIFDSANRKLEGKLPGIDTNRGEIDWTEDNEPGGINDFAIADGIENKMALREMKRTGDGNLISESEGEDGVNAANGTTEDRRGGLIERIRRAIKEGMPSRISPNSGLGGRKY
jgi:hypothetical protein